MVNTGLISEIQHFSVGDGPGIRTTVFFQGCNLACRWCHNPETIPRSGCVLRYPDKEKQSGTPMTLQAVLEELCEDEEFYRESGGGVTFSGGEPLLQPDFAGALARTCKAQEFHVIVDTAGCVPYEAFRKLLPWTDTFFFDLKAGSASDFQAKTGGNFTLVTENLRHLCQEAEVVVRIPVIPDYNDTPDRFDSFCRILESLPIKRVDLLPFHRMGSSKYIALSRNYEYADREPLPKEKLIPLREMLEGCGIQCKEEHE